MEFFQILKFEGSVDKGQRIDSALLGNWRTFSDREIARSLGVSNRSVSVRRKSLELAGRIIPREESTQGVQTCLDGVCTSAIRPAPENDSLYGAIDEAEPSFVALVESVRENGVLEPITVSADGYLMSGHRRTAAARVLGMQRVPVRVRYDVSYASDRDAFLRLLANFNRQRVKTTDAQVREELSLASEQSCRRVRQFRRESAVVSTGGLVELRGRKRRSAIRDKLELKQAIIEVIEAEQNNWPLSDRSVHYRLLNLPGLVRNDKTRAPYENSHEAYNDVTGMLTRLRLDGSIPFEAIADETRPVTICNAHQCVGDFVRSETNLFLRNYWRNLLQSQPNWIELLVEKNTIASQLKRVAEKYTLPMTSGRGYSSLPPRRDMVQRFKASGREKLILVVVADFDPEGQDIPGSFGISLRDDFGIPEHRLKVVKAALTEEQVKTLGLHAGQLSKETSSRYRRFVTEHGERCWELESLSTEQLREVVEASIRSVLDLEAFEGEVEREQQEQSELEEKRRQMLSSIR